MNLQRAAGLGELNLLAFLLKDIPSLILKGGEMLTRTNLKGAADSLFKVIINGTEYDIKEKTIHHAIQKALEMNYEHPSHSMSDWSWGASRVDISAKAVKVVVDE